MKLRIGVLSDFHCHPETAKPWNSLLHCDALRKPVNKHPIEALIQLISETPDIYTDALLLPGDFADKIDRQGFIKAWDFSLEVAEKLECSLVAATLGNHDVDYLKKTTKHPFQIAKDLHKAFPVSTPTEQNEFWSQGFCVLDSGELRVLVVNSVTQYDDPAEAKRGCITEQQLDALRSKLTNLAPARFQIALMHHHPIQHEIHGLGSEDLMKNGELLMSLLSGLKFHIAIHGHKHHPRLMYSAASGANPLVVFASGSVAATSTSGILTNTRNVFHIVELDDDDVSGCGPHGIIHSWQFHLHRGWAPASVESTDIPKVAGFGCRMDVGGLAKTASDWFSTMVGTPEMGYFEFEKLAEHIPQVKYLMPADMQHFGQVLSDTYGIELMPTPPNTPERIGRLPKIKNP